MSAARILCWSCLGVILVSCGGPGGRAGEGGGQGEDKAAVTVPLAFDQIEDVLGMTGVRREGQYKVAVPQNDLSVTVDGFRIIPPM